MCNQKAEVDKVAETLPTDVFDGLRMLSLAISAMFPISYDQKDFCNGRVDFIYGSGE